MYQNCKLTPFLSAICVPLLFHYPYHKTVHPSLVHNEHNLSSFHPRIHKSFNAVSPQLRRSTESISFHCLTKRKRIFMMGQVSNSQSYHAYLEDSFD